MIGEGPPLILPDTVPVPGVVPPPPPPVPGVVLPPPLLDPPPPPPQPARTNKPHIARKKKSLKPDFLKEDALMPFLHSFP